MPSILIQSEDNTQFNEDSGSQSIDAISSNMNESIQKMEMALNNDEVQSFITKSEIHLESLGKTIDEARFKSFQKEYTSTEVDVEGTSVLPSTVSTSTLGETTHHQPRVNVFNWVPRYKLSRNESMDSIVTFKEDLVNIQGPKFKMNTNEAQIPQIVVSDIPLEEGKCYYWEIKLTIDENSEEELYGDLIEIGLLNIERSSWELENISDQPFGWCLFADGCTGHNDEEIQYMKKCLENNDRIGVLCNLKYDCPGILSYYVNGISCGIAYSNITGPVHAAVSLVQESVEVEIINFEERS